MVKSLLLFSLLQLTGGFTVYVSLIYPTANFFHWTVTSKDCHQFVVMVSVSLLTLIAVHVVEVEVFFDVGLGPLMATPSVPGPGCYCAHGLDLRPGYSLHYTRLADMIIGQCGKFYRPKAHRCLPSSWLALLLLTSGVEAKRGPVSVSESSTAVRLSTMDR